LKPYQHSGNTELTIHSTGPIWLVELARHPHAPTSFPSFAASRPLRLRVVRHHPSSIRKLLGTTAKTTFHWVAKGKNETLMNLPGSAEGERFSLERRVAMEGQHISDAELAFIP